MAWHGMAIYMLYINKADTPEFARFLSDFENLHTQIKTENQSVCISRMYLPYVSPVCISRMYLPYVSPVCISRMYLPYVSLFVRDFNGHCQQWWPLGDSNKEEIAIDKLTSNLDMTQLITEPTNFQKNTHLPVLT